MAATTSPPVERRRATIAILLAGGVVAAAVTVIVVAGYVPLPTMPPLADASDPTVPGTIAFVHGDWEEACLSTVPASGGEVTTVRCAREVPEALAWTTDGDLALPVWREPVPFGDGTTLVVVDPGTGEEVDRMPADDTSSWVRERLQRADGARLVVDPSRDGAVDLRVRGVDGSTRDLLRLEGPRDYGLVSVQWSPDGEWVLALDTRGRLFHLAADGTPGPRLLADTGGRSAPMVLPAWWIDDVDAQRIALVRPGAAVGATAVAGVIRGGRVSR